MIRLVRTRPVYQKDRILALYTLTKDGIPVSKTCELGHHGWIWSVEILEQYRRQGLGTELMKRVLRSAKRSGIKTVALESSYMGFPLYEKLGFKQMEGWSVGYLEKHL